MVRIGLYLGMCVCSMNYDTKKGNEGNVIKIRPSICSVVYRLSSTLYLLNYGISRNACASLHICGLGAMALQKYNIIFVHFEPYIDFIFRSRNDLM